MCCYYCPAIHRTFPVSSWTCSYLCVHLSCMDMPLSLCLCMCPFPPCPGELGGSEGTEQGSSAQLDTRPGAHPTAMGGPAAPQPPQWGETRGQGWSQRCPPGAPTTGTDTDEHMAPETPNPSPSCRAWGSLVGVPPEAPEPGWGRTGSHPPPPSSSTFAPVFTLQEQLPCLDGGQEVRVLLGFTQKSPSVGLETLNNCFLSLFIPFIPAFNIPHFQQ